MSCKFCIMSRACSIFAYVTVTMKASTLTEYASVQNFRKTSAMLSEKCALQNNQHKLVITDSTTNVVNGKKS